MEKYICAGSRSTVLRIHRSRHKPLLARSWALILENWSSFYFKVNILNQVGYLLGYFKKMLFINVLLRDPTIKEDFCELLFACFHLILTVCRFQYYSY